MKKGRGTKKAKAVETAWVTQASWTFTARLRCPQCKRTVTGLVGENKKTVCADCTAKLLEQAPVMEVLAPAKGESQMNALTGFLAFTTEAASGPKAKK